MARTVNLEAHGVRRDAFLDAAQRLIQSKGYEQMSVQDVLDALDASKGGFYHYFDSKSALLDAVVERMVEAAIGSVQPIVDDPGVPAPDKLHGVFAGIASYKNARRDFLLALMKVWLSDDNAIVREKFRKSVGARFTPLLASIIRQGVAEGTFDVASADDAARVFVALLMGANESAVELFLARQAGRVPFEVVERTLDAYGDAFDRLLGARPGTLRWIDRETLHTWYG
jgi:AcrR family transcriptional regulator